MQGLFNFITSSFNGDAISNCANNIKEIKHIKCSYPPIEKSIEHSINLKA